MIVKAADASFNVIAAAPLVATTGPLYVTKNGGASWLAYNIGNCSPRDLAFFNGQLIVSCSAAMPAMYVQIK